MEWIRSWQGIDDGCQKGWYGLAGLIGRRVKKGGGKRDWFAVPTNCYGLAGLVGWRGLAEWVDWLEDGWMGGSTGTLAGWEMAGWVDWLGDGWMEGLKS